MVAAQQEASTDRKSAEIQFVNDCMEGRGYTRGSSLRAKQTTSP